MGTGQLDLVHGSEDGEHEYMGIDGRIAHMGYGYGPGNGYWHGGVGSPPVITAELSKLKSCYLGTLNGNEVITVTFCRHVCKYD